MKKLLFLLLLAIPLANSFAQDADTLVTVDLSSPYHTIYTHLYFTQTKNLDLDKAGRVFDSKNISEKDAQKYAVKLKQLLDGSGHYIDLSRIPKNPNYYDSAANDARYVPVDDFPNIYLKKIGRRWLFPKESALAIASLHQETFPYGTDELLEVMPKMGQREVFGIELWKLIGLFILILLAFLVHKLLTFIFDTAIRNALRKAGYSHVADRYVKPIARPVSLFVVFFLVSVFIPILQLPANTSQYIIKGLRALLPFFGTIVFYRLVNILGAYFDKVAEKTENTLDDQLVPLIKKAMRTFVVIVGGLVILDNLDIPIIPLLTGLSIGGLAFALAAQDTIKNFFGSLLIFIDKPFQIGDWITSSGVDGTVEEVGFRATRVRTFRNSLVYVPNGTLADGSIDNHGLRKYRRFYTQIAVTYDTPTHLIEVFVEGLRKIVLNHPNTYKENYHVYLNDMADSSLNIMFYIFFSVPDWGAELKARHEVILSIIKLAEELGVNFAFPTQTLHVENLPGQPSLSPVYIQDKAELQAKMEAYVGGKATNGKNG